MVIRVEEVDREIGHLVEELKARATHYSNVRLDSGKYDLPQGLALKTYDLSSERVGEESTRNASMVFNPNNGSFRVYSHNSATYTELPPAIDNLRKRFL